MDLDVSQLHLQQNDDENLGGNLLAKDVYRKELALNLFGGGGSGVLALRTPKPPPRAPLSLRVRYEQNRAPAAKPPARRIPCLPERILDAPELLDDYYLNLLDWSEAGPLAIALGDAVYGWNPHTHAITKLAEADTVCSVAWPQASAHAIAVGDSVHTVQIWSAETGQQLRSMRGHTGRVSALAWNGPVLASAGRGEAILFHDVRAKEHYVGSIRRAHSAEICGLKWSSGGLLASGGNDNLLCVWDARSLRSSHLGGRDGGWRGGGGVAAQPLYRCEQHRAAVKALAWCPWQRNVLASGGGTSDRTVRCWDFNTGACLSALDTGAQVCALQWAVHEKEIVSCHGYASNSIVVWKYPSMVKHAEVTGHAARVLHMALSPDGTTVATAAADETLRFWRILAGDEAAEKAWAGPTPGFNTAAIR